MIDLHKLNVNNLDINELEIALRKLKHYYYYEKSDLATRSAVLQYDNENLKSLNNLANDPTSANPYFDQISINIYPKKVKAKGESQNESNLFSNEHLTNGTQITEFLFMASIPVELHLISVVWLMRYGNILETALSDHALGNRMEKIGENLNDRKIFKNYINQYQKWWRGAITTCKEQLQSDRNVTMINYDIKSFYNSVDINIDEIEEFIFKSPIYSPHNNIKISNDPIHIIIKELHKKYKEKYHDIIGNKAKRNTVLPIGLLTSFVFANWYLKDIDKAILNLNPVFYGRYVDDFIIIFHENNSKEYKNVKDVIMKKFKDILDIDDISENKFKFKSIPTLLLQEQKTFVYYFSHKYPPGLLDKFIDEQKLRSSEFRFLSDEEDESFGDFEKITFEQNFDFDDGNRARFRVIEENKFKMSAYLSKLIVRKIKNETPYKNEEIDKIYKYFKGYYLIKHYQFWEKIFALFIVYKEYGLFNKMIDEINKEIDDLDINDNYLDISKIKLSIKEYLKIAIDQVMVLKPKQTFQSKENVYNSKYLLSLRSHFTYYPWLQYTSYAQSGNLDLTNREEFTKHSFKDFDLNIDTNNIPYRIKFYYAFMQEFYKKMYTNKPI